MGFPDHLMNHHLHQVPLPSQHLEILVNYYDQETRAFILNREFIENFNPIKLLFFELQQL
jgi:hypothetical protein